MRHRNSNSNTDLLWLQLDDGGVVSELEGGEGVRVVLDLGSDRAEEIGPGLFGVANGLAEDL